MARRGEKVDETARMTWETEPASVRKCMFLDGDWYEGRPEPKTQPGPPPTPPRRVLIEVPDLPDDELEASHAYLRIKVWKRDKGVGFWMPVETMRDEEMKITHAIANRFPVPRDY
jgi:hypothetical protein